MSLPLQSHDDFRREITSLWRRIDRISDYLSSQTAERRKAQKSARDLEKRLAYCEDELIRQSRLMTGMIMDFIHVMGKYPEPQAPAPENPAPCKIIKFGK